MFFLYISYNYSFQMYSKIQKLSQTASSKLKIQTVRSKNKCNGIYLQVVLCKFFGKIKYWLAIVSQHRSKRPFNKPL